MPRILTLSLNPSIDVSSEADGVRSSHKVRTFEETYDPGGGSINVARVISELAGDVEVLYLGGGPTGLFLEDLLARRRLNNRRVAIHGYTRISYTVHDRTSGLEYRFVGSGPSIEPQELQTIVELVRQTEFSYLVASGSLPLGVPPDTFATIGRIVASKHALFVLDSSGPGLARALGATPIYLVKPSLNELSQLAGRELDDEDATSMAMQLVTENAAEIVAVTLGERGALVATRQGAIRIPALKVETRSTVGAGDSFLGAMLLALATGHNTEDAALNGIAAGAAAVLRPGTQLADRDDVFSLLEKARRMRGLSTKA